jgi:hypothetical protein
VSSTCLRVSDLRPVTRKCVRAAWNSRYRGRSECLASGYGAAHPTAPHRVTKTGSSFDSKAAMYAFSGAMMAAPLGCQTAAGQEVPLDVDDQQRIPFPQAEALAERLIPTRKVAYCSCIHRQYRASRSVQLDRPARRPCGAPERGLSLALSPPRRIDAYELQLQLRHPGIVRVPGITSGAGIRR